MADEVLMNEAVMHLTAGIDASVTTITVDDSSALETALSGGGKQTRLRCEGEVLLCTAAASGSLTVSRGAETGFAADVHPAGALVEPVLTEAGIEGRLAVVAATIAVGPTGPAGADGADGAPGADGVGVPTGGASGDVLTKASSTNYDTHWVAPSSASGMAYILLPLPAYATSTGGWAVYVAGNAGPIVYNSPSWANGGILNWGIWVPAGTYTIHVRGGGRTDAPKVDVAIDGSVVGTIDMYAGTNADASYSITGVVLSAGYHDFALVINGKNASNVTSYYRCQINAVALQQTA